jgi:hypothetical protein
MKDFFKKASIYILVMLLAAGIIFSLNYYYGQKISEDVEAEIAEIAENNNYQLRLVEVETNPLLQEMRLQNLNLIKADQFNLIINLAEIKFSWQQILNYIRRQNFELDKNFESTVAQINYSNLQDNYQLNFSDAEVNYQGELPEEKLAQISTINDLYLLMDEDHALDFRAAELKYDFPYYRSYGLNNENWNRLSTFNNFNMRANYNQENQNLKIEEFNLSGEFLKAIFNLDSELNYDQQAEKIIFNELKGDYDFLLAAEELDFEANSYFQELKLNQLDFNGSLDFVREDDDIQANQLDFNLNLSEFKLILAEALSQQLNQNSFGILAAENNFEILIDKFSYHQDYSYPNGSSQSSLDSSLVMAELEAEYNYNQELPYVSSGNLKYQPQTARAEQLNSFLQLVLGKRLNRDQDGYYELKFWGAVDDLNFE